MVVPGLVPNLVMAQRVIDKIASAAQRYIEDETGEAMVGLVTPGPNEGVPTIYVLDTISPDETAIRQMHTFQQGDALQDELIWWLQENWYARREINEEYGKPASKWDVPLRYLGDWHKQPGYMIAPSMGDLMTALGWLDDDENQMDYLLAPIVTMGHPGTVEAASNVNYFTIPQGDGSAIRIDFWYIHRETRVFQPISPAVYPDDHLPTLAPYPWHLINEDRITLELARFEQNQMFTSVLLWNADNELPLEVCIASARMGANKIFLIATPHDYPQSPPKIRLAPFTSMKEEQTVADVFGKWWEESEPTPDVWQWAQDRHLIDYVQAIEDALGLKPEPVVVEITDTDDAGEAHPEGDPGTVVDAVSHAVSDAVSHAVSTEETDVASEEMTSVKSVEDDDTITDRVGDDENENDDAATAPKPENDGATDDKGQIE